MVINNDPCYAYLQESNAVTDQKLVMAHVYGHADFFKNNLWFSKTNRKMMDQMANHATRVRRHIERQGRRPSSVHRPCLSIEHLIDPHSMFVQREESRGIHASSHRGRTATATTRTLQPRPVGFTPDKLPAKDYMDPFINPAARRCAPAQKRERHERSSGRQGASSPRADARRAAVPAAPRAARSPGSRTSWSIIRDEAYYFAPQGMTKVMNEGWATYWHSKLMTQHFLEAKEIIHYADQHSGVVHMPPGGFNPYKIGVELFKDIERRWNAASTARVGAPGLHRRQGGLRRQVHEGAREDLRGPPDLQRRELHRRVPHAGVRREAPDVPAQARPADRRAPRS
jgi:stage V sporulation protein R